MSVSISSSSSNSTSKSTNGVVGEKNYSDSKQQYRLITIGIITSTLCYYGFEYIIKQRRTRRRSRRQEEEYRYNEDANGNSPIEQQKQMKKNLPSTSNSITESEKDTIRMIQSGVIGHRGYQIASGIGPNVIVPCAAGGGGLDGTNNNSTSVVVSSSLFTNTTINPMILYINKFFTALQDQCVSLYDNPIGYIILCVAENKLCTNLLSDRFNQLGTAEAAFNELSMYNYNSFLGIPMARDAAAYFLAKRFYKTTKSDQIQQQQQQQQQQEKEEQDKLQHPLRRSTVISSNVTTPIHTGTTSTVPTTLSSIQLHEIDQSSLGSSSSFDDYTTTTTTNNNNNNRTTVTTPQPTTTVTTTSSSMVFGAGLLEEHMTIDSNCVVIGSGASSLLSNLFYALTGGGGGGTISDNMNSSTSIDCCLIPAPYYANFDNDMYMIARVVPFPIYNIANMRIGPTQDELNVAYEQARKLGYVPRFLLLSNPNNPLGIIYPSSTIRSVIQWARSKSCLAPATTSTTTKSTTKKNTNVSSNPIIHVIVDEIYALTVHPTAAVEFQSVIQVLDNQLGVDVHMIWALSKDFGGSGLRYGILYSQNELLIKALGSINMMSAVSQPIQYMISEVLTDDMFIDQYLYHSIQSTTRSCYDICCAKLNEMVIPYIQPDAAIYVYADFSSLLPTPTFEAERQFSDLLFDAKIVMTPGESQREMKPGMYRICYAWVSPDVLSIGMERLSRLVAKLRRMDWDDIVNNEPMRCRIIRYVLGNDTNSSTTATTSSTTH